MSSISTSHISLLTFSLFLSLTPILSLSLSLSLAHSLSLALSLLLSYYFALFLSLSPPLSLFLSFTGGYWSHPGLSFQGSFTATSVAGSSRLIGENESCHLRARVTAHTHATHARARCLSLFPAFTATSVEILYVTMSHVTHK